MLPQQTLFTGFTCNSHGSVGLHLRGNARRARLHYAYHGRLVAVGYHYAMSPLVGLPHCRLHTTHPTHTYTPPHTFTRFDTRDARCAFVLRAGRCTRAKTRCVAVCGMTRRYAAWFTTAACNGRAHLDYPATGWIRCTTWFYICTYALLPRFAHTELLIHAVLPLRRAYSTDSPCSAAPPHAMTLTPLCHTAYALLLVGPAPGQPPHAWTVGLHGRLRWF